MYELDKRLALASMLVRLLFFPSQGMPIGKPIIMPTGNVLALDAYQLSEPTGTFFHPVSRSGQYTSSLWLSCHKGLK
ncbi:hypothetical protein M405DRAFT_826717 [Rhizopogon salebrosus TDB-379]|nr:hypothetical protein M405DRAFT_826717 [Rhizopogon salebrosus TDB-379]